VRSFSDGREEGAHSKGFTHWTSPEEPGLYVQKLAAFYGLSEAPAQDPDGISVENFGMADNLMMMGAIDDAGYGIETEFEQAVNNIAAYFTANPP
jgi:hypothetical protein